MCATFTVAPVIERTNGVTALQHCSGSPVWIDWLARYIWDFCNIFPAFITITIILFASRNVAGLSSLTDNYELFTVLFIVRVLDTTSSLISPLPVEIKSFPVLWNSLKVFLIAILPLMYIWSLLFDHSSTAIAYSSLANTLLAMGTFVAVIVMRQIERSEPEVMLEDRKSWLMGNIFTIFPQVGFRKSPKKFKGKYNETYKSSILHSECLRFMSIRI